jgi:hypothetical protein
MIAIKKINPKKINENCKGFSEKIAFWSLIKHYDLTILRFCDKISGKRGIAIYNKGFALVNTFLTKEPVFPMISIDK